MTVRTPTGGSSQEHSTMGASLIERRRVQEEGLRVVNCFSPGTSPVLFGFLVLTKNDPNHGWLGEDEVTN